MDEPKFININGYDTLYIDKEDESGKYFLIGVPDYASPNIAHLSGKFIDDKMITCVDYQYIDGRRFIVARHN